jgi:hypothetical protein
MIPEIRYPGGPENGESLLAATAQPFFFPKDLGPRDYCFGACGAFAVPASFLAWGI